MSLVTIKTSHNEIDLLFLKSRLESEGITYYLKNEYSTQVLNHIQSNEVELQISEADIERVKLILEEEQL